MSHPTRGEQEETLLPSPRAFAAMAKVTTLSGRQQEVLRHAAAGKTRPETAKAMGISEGRVNAHLAMIGRKLNATGRQEILKRAEQCGFIPSPLSEVIAKEVITMLSTGLFWMTNDEPQQCANWLKSCNERAKAFEAQAKAGKELRLVA